jgi:hypothetical protein
MSERSDLRPETIANERTMQVQHGLAFHERCSADVEVSNWQAHDRDQRAGLHEAVGNSTSLFIDIDEDQRRRANSVEPISENVP